jgi:preprotein translocase subunit YajC
MTLAIPLILAQATPPASPGGFGGLGGMMIPMLVIFGIMYFMLIRPQQRKEKERRAMIDNVKTGDRVLFSGGILGTIANVKETTFLVKIADNVKIEVARGGVTKVLDKGDKVTKEDVES